MKRLHQVAGEWIDRTSPIAFSFEGVNYTGYVGDTISSALLANGVGTLARSFKYHRQRSVLSFANHDANVIVQDVRAGAGGPNVRADIEPLQDGMQLRAVNTFGGLAADRARWLDKLGSFMPVGFYYKAFNSKRWFPKWEQLFRVLTGLGVLDVTAPRIKTPKRYAFADVLVTGAGPSGLAAALQAADAGAQVMLVDENALPGGSAAFALGVDAAQRSQFEVLLSRVQGHPRIRVVCGSFAAGYYADHWVPVVEPGHITKVRARSVVVATGAFEQPAVFRNNDLPGVMLASAALRLLHRHAVVTCSRAVVLAANSDAYRAALDLHAHGVQIESIVDLRAQGEDTQLAKEVAALGITVRQGWAIHEALPGKNGSVRSVSIAPLLPEAGAGSSKSQTGLGVDLARAETLACDGVLMSVGWAPALALAYQAGMKVGFDDNIQQFVPAELPEGVFVCGRANGIYDFGARLIDGSRAGHAAAHSLGLLMTPPPPHVNEASCPSHPYPIVAHPKGRNFIDFDEDLQLKDFFNAAQEGFDNIELLKRFSTVGMGPSQGKHSNMNAIRVLARIRGQGVAQVGSTTSRPMFHPVPMALLAGRGVALTRRTPAHEQHRALGAHFMHAGAWERPEYYARSGMSREQAIWAEVHQVRHAVGVIDVGTLGKIDVIGPDAAEFLERVYTDRFSRMKIGAIRYGLMLDESGVVADDGIVARLSSDHFYFTTTTTGSAVVYRELQRRQAMWGLRISLVNLTGQLTAFNLAGPHARKVLARLTPAAIDGEHFPFMAMREAVVAGVPARLLRIGFVGELGYEIHVHADQGIAVWDALFKAGADFDIKPFGVEAQRVLRLEKGHPIVGQDTDGVTNPLEAGLAWALKEEKPFYIGQRSLEVLRKQPQRQTLVGFQLHAEAAQRPKECHLAIHNGDIAGRITSIAWSPTLGRVIGLALIDPVLKAQGNFSIRVDDGSLVQADIVPLPFYDPEHARQKIGDSDAPATSALASVSTLPTVHAPRVKSVNAEWPEQSGVELLDMATVHGGTTPARFGCKGLGSPAWLSAHGFDVPQLPNTWTLNGDVLCARLGMGEYLIEAAPGQVVAEQVVHGFYAALHGAIDQGVAPVARADTEWILRGPRVHELLLQVCSFNFQSLVLKDAPVVLTLLLGVAVTVIARETDSGTEYRMWFDNSYATTLREALMEIATEMAIEHP